MKETVVTRFQKVLNFQKPVDRMPMVEWAAWWDKTIARWQSEDAFSNNLNFLEIQQELLLDPMQDILVRGIDYSICPKPASHGGHIILDKKDYQRLQTGLFSEKLLQQMEDKLYTFKEYHDRGDLLIRIWMDGFFWFPRAMFGIENHFYAFYDYPDLMLEMNEQLADFNIRAVERMVEILKPDFIGITEDMSYNHGPMLSKELFDTYIAPFYKKLIPVIHKHNIKVFVDSDGDITTMMPWFLECEVDGVYPLERQAGIDLPMLRKQYPNFLFLGGYDKMVMSKGEEAMRKEFERLLPVWQSGGYILSVDHQTPPEVSFENYRIYLKLLEEYSRKAI